MRRKCCVNHKQDKVESRMLGNILAGISVPIVARCSIRSSECLYLSMVADITMGKEQNKLTLWLLLLPMYWSDRGKLYLHLTSSRKDYRTWWLCHLRFVAYLMLNSIDSINLSNKPQRSKCKVSDIFCKKTVETNLSYVWSLFCFFFLW